MNLSPLNRRRFERFKANKRGWWSLWIFLVLFGLSLNAEFIAKAKDTIGKVVRLEFKEMKTSITEADRAERKTLAENAAKEAAASDWSAESPAFSHSSTSEESMERTSTRSQEMMSSSCSSRFSGGTVRASSRIRCSMVAMSAPIADGESCSIATRCSRLSISTSSPSHSTPRAAAALTSDITRSPLASTIASTSDSA